MKIDSLKQYLLLQQSLQKEKAALEARLAQINAVLGQAPAKAAAVPPPQSAPAARRPQAKHAMSLREAINKVISVKPLTKQEIFAAVQKAGYKFTNAHPLAYLNATLYAKGNFKNVNGKFSPLKK